MGLLKICIKGNTKSGSGQRGVWGVVVVEGLFGRVDAQADATDTGHAAFQPVARLQQPTFGVGHDDGNDGGVLSKFFAVSQGWPLNREAACRSRRAMSRPQAKPEMIPVMSASAMRKAEVPWPPPVPFLVGARG